VSIVDVQNTPNRSETTEVPPWWRQAAICQFYPRSFADANADCLGDIPGIISKAEYLAELGIDAVWLSPFCSSDLAEGGSGVAD